MYNREKLKGESKEKRNIITHRKDGEKGVVGGLIREGLKIYGERWKEFW